MRKNAATLLTVVLEHNPFAGSLDEQTFKSKQAHFEKVLAERLEDLKTKSSGGQMVERTMNTIPEEVEMAENLENTGKYNFELELKIK